MESDNNTTPEHVFCHLLESFVLGMGRLLSARLTSLTAQVAILRYRSREAHEHADNPYDDVLGQIKSIAHGEFDAYTYVTNLSHLTYATTLLDTFLSDSAKFLLLLHPKAIGKNQSVTLDAVLGAGSKAEIVSQAATKKVRELGYLPFVARIQFLQETFGLKLSLLPAVSKNLEHFSSIRNIAIHDQGVYDCFLTEAHAIDIRQKTCAVHPTAVSATEIAGAVEAYAQIVREITASIVTQVLKAEATEYGRRAMQSIGVLVGQASTATPISSGSNTPLEIA